jgi:hypothetical protein
MGEEVRVNPVLLSFYPFSISRLGISKASEDILNPISLQTLELLPALSANPSTCAAQRCLSHHNIYYKEAHSGEQGQDFLMYLQIWTEKAEHLANGKIE